MLDEKEQKLKKYEDFEIIKEETKNELRETIIDSFLTVFRQLINNINPIHNYIRRRVEPLESIKAVFLHEKSEVYDLWFIIEEDDFNLELNISQIIGELFEIFDTILFDSLSFTINEVNLDELKKESYGIIYLKE